VIVARKHAAVRNGLKPPKLQAHKLAPTFKWPPLRR
jgi:hypothetical protein